MHDSNGNSNTTEYFCLLTAKKKYTPFDYGAPEILCGKRVGKTTFIPQIPLSHPSFADLPFNFLRMQFPFRLKFAMTVNQAQGQTLSHVGLVLKDPVFTGGQLYLALSRLINNAKLLIVVPDTDAA
jgi:hypothetical protein